MGKVKIKRKSTLIDMTAMSDVTVLLLTFFMLTSTFLAKEPTVVNTPSSVSEEKVPLSNIVTLLVSAQDKKNDPEGLNGTEGKVFLSLMGDDSENSTILTPETRIRILEKAVAEYNDIYKKDIRLSDAQKAVFADINMFGVTFDYLPEFLDPNMSISDRDQIQGNLLDKRVGIPTVKADGQEIVFRDSKPTELMIWLRAILESSKQIRDDMVEYYQGEVDKYKSGPKHDDAMAKLEILQGKDGAKGQNFYQFLKDGKGLTVKADQFTPYEVLNNVFKNLRAESLNRFLITTALKSENTH